MKPRIRSRTPGDKQSKRKIPKTRQPRSKAARTSPQFDWSWIAKGENHRHFELMAGDIISYELDSNLFTPNAMKSGPDGGADGVYQGAISGISGPWKIASASRSKLAALKKKIEDENRGAKRNGYRGLLFITSFDLDPTQVKKLSLVAGKSLKKGIIWPRGKLDQLLRKHPWIAAQHLGHPLIPGFIPAGCSEREEPSGQADIDLVGREDVCAKIANFLNSDDRVLIFVGPGGAGKSRVVRELATISRQGRPRRSAWLRRVGQGTLDKSIEDGLPVSTPIVVVLDDAGQAIDEVRHLARLATDPRLQIDARLVLAAREVDRDAVLAALDGARLKTRELDLKEIGMEARVAIVQQDCPRLSLKDANRLSKVFGKNLFLLRAALQCIKEGRSPRELVNLPHLRDMVARRFLKEAEKLLKGLPGVAAEDVLLDIAVGTPVHASRLEEPVIATLKEGGLLRRVGSSVRFRTDVEGDVLLGYLLRQPRARVRVQSLLAESGANLLAQVRNLAAAGRGEPGTIIQELCRLWLGSIGMMPVGQHSSVASVLPFCAELARNETADLCRLLGTFAGITTDEVGPTVFAFARYHGSVAALELAYDTRYASIPEGAYSNYKIDKLGDGIVDVRRVGIGDIRQICTLIEGWVRTVASSEVAATSVSLIRTALAPMLRMVVRFEEAEPDKISWGEQALRPTADVLEMRSRALAILESLLLHPSQAMRLAGAQIFHEHVHTGGTMASPDELLPVLDVELDRLSPALAKILSHSQDYEVRHVIEKELFFVWGTERPGHVKAGALLRQASTTPGYRAYAFVLEPWDFRFDVSEIVASSPAEGRTDWWVQRTTDPERSEHARLLADVVSTYTTPETLVDLVDALPNTKDLPSLLDPWCERLSELFEKALVLASGRRAHGSLSQTIARWRRRHKPEVAVEEIRSAVEAGDVARVDHLVQEGTALPLESLVKAARMLVESELIDFRAHSLRLVRYRSDVDRIEVAALLARALRAGVWTKSLDIVWSVVRQLSRTVGGLASFHAGDLVGLVLARLFEAGRDSSWEGQSDYYVKQLLDLVFVGPEGESDRITYVDSLLPGKEYGVKTLIKWCLHPLLKSETSLRELAVFGCDWVRKGKLSSVENLVYHLRGATDRDALPKHARPLAIEFLARTEPEEQELGLRFLAEFPDAETCAIVAETAVQPGRLGDVAKNLLTDFGMSGRPHSRTTGEPSPEMTALQLTLESAYQIVHSAEAKYLILNSIQTVQGIIQEERCRDEETLDPR